jgi:hypothetical protein
LKRLKTSNVQELKTLKTGLVKLERNEEENFEPNVVNSSL